VTKVLQVSQVYKIAPKVLTEHGKTKSVFSSSPPVLLPSVLTLV
jgi:hypothetical protein